LFFSQLAYNYNWTSIIFDENSSDLELVYALTVQKSQGSKFNKVILILGEPYYYMSVAMS